MMGARMPIMIINYQPFYAAENLLQVRIHLIYESRHKKIKAIRRLHMFCKIIWGKYIEN